MMVGLFHVFEVMVGLFHVFEMMVGLFHVFEMMVGWFLKRWLVCFMSFIWTLTYENMSSGFANNNSTDLPAYPCRLFSAFEKTNHYLKNMKKLTII